MSDAALNKNGMTELHLAAYHGELDWVQNCIDGGLDVNARDKAGWTPLHWAADMGMVGPDDGEREAIVRLLISSGADANAVAADGESVFFRAVSAGNREIVRLLIAAGADVHGTDKRGDTALALAIANEDWEMAEVIKRAHDSGRAE